MKFTLEINMDNAAFQDNRQINELQQILIDTTEKIDIYNRLNPEQAGSIWDSNGNKVGTWEVTE